MDVTGFTTYNLKKKKKGSSKGEVGQVSLGPTVTLFREFHKQNCARIMFLKFSRLSHITILKIANVTKSRGGICRIQNF